MGDEAGGGVEIGVWQFIFAEEVSGSVGEGGVAGVVAVGWVGS